MSQLLQSLKKDCANVPSCTNSLFTIWGWTKEHGLLSPSLKEFARERGVEYLTWDYGSSGLVYLINSHPDVARSDDMVVVKLGFARSDSFEPLSAQDLLQRGLATPEGIRLEAIHGDLSVISISQREPVFSAYQSVVSTAQLYYWHSQDAILCSDTPRHLAAMIDGLDIDPEAVLIHLMYRCVSGELTYFKDVRKLLCGHVMTVKASECRIQQVERLDDLRPERPVSVVTAEAISEFEHQAERLMGAYVQQTAWSDRAWTISLSGGVDSTLLGSLAQAAAPPAAKLRSISVVMHVPSFAPEIEYAKYGAALLDSEHQFVDVYPEQFPDLLMRSIDTIARPIAHEIQPCCIVLAQLLSQKAIGYLLCGSAADSLLGSGDSKRWLQLERLQRMPKASSMLKFLGSAVEPLWHNKAYGMREAAQMLAVLKDPELGFPTVHTDFEMVKKCFPARSIARVFEYQRDLTSLYTSTSSLAERTHLTAITHDVHDEEIDLVQMLQAWGLCSVTPFLDSHFVQSALAFEPRVRFYASDRVKWLPKLLVERRVGYQVDRYPKNAGGFSPELFQWMRDGVLRDMMDSMERPGYVSAADFQRMREQPDWFTWNVLNLDLFQKRFLKSRVSV